MYRHTHIIQSGASQAGYVFQGNKKLNTEQTVILDWLKWWTNLAKIDLKYTI